ncbi:Hypothetical predicted protein [Prunus dulcis]|uniref:Uncharacterized protein n=1 Tax=Prunus dulcis TaxID=3755 RepID=A0A5E4FIM3_PRUDU|nr:Hypothetical predicted protein [Prunus dulcis]
MEMLRDKGGVWEKIVGKLGSGRFVEVVFGGGAELSHEQEVGDVTAPLVTRASEMCAGIETPVPRWHEQQLRFREGSDKFRRWGRVSETCRGFAIARS